MRNLLLPLLLLFCTIMFNPVIAQTINIDAAIKYWEITDNLRQNQPITDEVWNNFLQIQGNKIYIKQVFDSSYWARYRKAMEIVYMPKHDSLLQVRLKANNWMYVLINNLKTNEVSYKQFLKETSESPKYLDLMYTLANEALPEKEHRKVKDLKLYYTALGNDGTSQKEGIFFSLYSAVTTNKIKEGILEAHELFHQLKPVKDFKNLEDSDMNLFRIVVFLHNEGTADLIDKKAILLAGGVDSVDILESYFLPAHAAIQKLDSAFQAFSKEGSEFSLTRIAYRKIMGPSNGHMPGFYMATIIEKNGFKKEMLETIDDPFAFIKLYHKAAKKDQSHPPVFSKTSMAYLKKLEQKWSSKPKPKKEIASVNSKL